MAVNVSTQFTADVENYIADKTLPIARRQLVVYQFGDPLELPKGRGTTYTATRFNRVPLPFAPLSEGVPPIGQTMTFTQVSATALQWGDKITLTDVAELTIKHPLFQKAIELIGLQAGETLERNTFNNLMALTQVNFVNSRTARNQLVAGDVINTFELIRARGALDTLGAIRFDSADPTDVKKDAGAGEPEASNSPRNMSHYCAVMHTLVEADFTQNNDVKLAWSYSDLYRLYNDEAGEWGGIRFCRSNLVPTFTSMAQINFTPVGTGGSFPAATYFAVVTASDTQNQYESLIAPVSASAAIVANGSATVVLPARPGFTYNIYIGTTATPGNLALSAAGPTSGPMTGQATQLNPGQTVTITGVGVPQVPPSAPPPGGALTVYPMFIFGRGAYGQVMLDDISTTYLTGADKSDPLNQQRVVGWKVMYGTIILNQMFACMIESVSAFKAVFDATVA
jgi:N4-gp56 family major capsid protein